jgi:hypothetical protein
MQLRLPWYQTLTIVNSWLQKGMQNIDNASFLVIIIATIA